MSLARKVAHNTIVQIASKVIATVLGLVSVGIITRHLGQYGFGEYTTIVNFLTFFATLADLGITLVTVQLISQPDSDERFVLGNLLGFRIVSAISFLLPAPLIAYFFPYSAAVKFGILISTIIFFNLCLQQIFIGLFQKHLRMNRVSIAEVMSRVILLAGILLSIRWGLGLDAFLVSNIASSLAGLALLYYFSRPLCLIIPKFHWPFWRQTMAKSWPLAVTIVFNLIYLRADTLILSLIKSPADVGLYGAAYKVLDVLITIPFMFAGIVLPIITHSWAMGDKEKFQKALQKSFDLMAIIAIPLVAGTQLLGGRVMVLVAGADFALSGPIISILIFAAGIIFLGCVFSHAVIALDKQRQTIPYYIFVAITALIGYIIFIPRYSYFGAAYVTVYSELAIALAAFYLTRKYSGFLPKLNVAYKSLIASLIMMGILRLYPSDTNLAIIILISAANYAVLLYLFKGVTKEDVMEILSKS